MQRYGKNAPNWKGGRKNDRGYIRVLQPDHPRANPNGYVLEHILIAEKALGKPLPLGAVVHHCGARDDQTQLVICENQAYHLLLHQRMRALKACGHASWRKCFFCKQYDKPENLYIKGQNAHHKKCISQYRKKRYHKKQEVK